MWIPGRCTRIGILLTIAGFMLVTMTWHTWFGGGVAGSYPDETALWLSFPLCGFLLGWSQDASEARRLLLVVAMALHWVIIGLALDRALALRSKTDA